MTDHTSMDGSKPAAESSSSAYHPFHILPLHGSHTRAASVVQFAPSSLHRTPGQSFNSHQDDLTAVCASASADGSIKLWGVQHSLLGDHENETPSQEPDTHLEGEQHNDTIQENARSTKKVKKDHSSSDATPMAIITAPSGVNDLAWSPCSVFGVGRGDDSQRGHFSQYIATACDDKALYLWDVHRSFQGGGKPVVAGEPSGGNSKKRDAVVEFKGHSNFCFSVAFNPQGNILASGSFDETVKLWDVRSGDCITTLPAHSDPVSCVDFTPDGTCLVSSSHDGLIRIWDVATGQCLKTIFYINEDECIPTSAPSGDGKNGSKDKDITNKMNNKNSMTPPVGYVKYSPNGKFILSSTLDGKLRLTDVTKRYDDVHETPIPLVLGDKSNASTTSRQGKDQLCMKTYTGHSCRKHCIFSDFMIANPKWQGVVTGSEDGMVYIYDLQRRNIQQKLQYDNNGTILAVASHPSIELLATGCTDNTVRFWAPKKKL